MRKQAEFAALATLIIGAAVSPLQAQGAASQAARPQINAPIITTTAATLDLRAKRPATDRAPHTAAGKILIGGAPGELPGLWLPDEARIIADASKVPFLPWAKALYDFRQTTELEPHARCKASGGPRQFITPYGVEIAEVPELGRLFIIDIGGPHTFREVYMDGRGHPAHVIPSNYGHSIGWWEGDSLVIDTVGFNEDFWFDRRGLPHTEALHLMERLTRVSKNMIEYNVTVEDPGAYAKPFTGGLNLSFEPKVELFEYMCQQANYAHELMVGKDATNTTISRASPIVP